MPFGTKPDASGALIDFDAVYSDLILPAIRDAELEPLRADEEMTGGGMNTTMFERLILAEYAVADLSTVNANVFYQLGVRHAVRPRTTILLYAEGRRLPFDVSILRALPYRVDKNGHPKFVTRTQPKLADLLLAADDPTPDSPIFTLVPNWKAPELDPLTTDTFRNRIRDSAKMKERLANARRRGVASLNSLASEWGDLQYQDVGLIIDLFLSYRAVSGWQEMVGLYERMSPALQSSVMVREQLALALNRAGDSAAAEQILSSLIAERGPSSETCGILGRVYKDRWEKAAKRGDPAASTLLQHAIEAYLEGFQADWRDAYPGINAVTLMELSETPDPRREQILPVVRYAVERRIAAGQPDYWDYATLVELGVLGKDEVYARRALESAMVRLREPWEAETTARNLRLINEARQRRHEADPWMLEIEETLHTLSERSSLSA
jgi:hypothetical protein